LKKSVLLFGLSIAINKSEFFMELIKIPLEGNERNLIQTYQDVYADTPDIIPSVAELRWRFGGNPYQVHIWVVRDENKIVGLRPIAVRPIKIGEAVYPSLYMLNVMVHPAYQGKGLFRSLMEKAWDMHAEEGVIAVTFPNENSIKAYQRWKDWFQLAEMPLFVRMVPPRSFTEKKSLARLFAGYFATAVYCARCNKAASHRITVQKVDSFDEGMQTLWERNKKYFDFIMPRNPQYLNWRYIERPAVKYIIYKAVANGETSGFLVTRTRLMFGMQLGLIVDFFVNNNERTVIAAMLEKAVTDLIDQGVQAICIQFVGPQSLKKALWDNGFIAVPKKILPRKFFMYARPGMKKVEGLRFPDFHNLFLTWGDNDAV
jgi:GNAT superfamily N-acetyltransferase